jgi:hypothetical protein
MLRSAAALVAGYLSMAVLVMLGTVAATAALVPGGLAALRGGAAPGVVPAGYLAANLVVSLLGAILGGWVAARIGLRAPLAHALVLAAVAGALALLGAVRGAQPGQPAWYPWALVAIAIGGIVLGGWIRAGDANARVVAG